MKMSFKPPLLVLLCSAGLFAASGVMFVNSRTTPPAPAAQPTAAQPAAPVTDPVVAPAFTAAQIDQWVSVSHFAGGKRLCHDSLAG